MSEPNPYKSGEYEWGPGQQPGTPAYGYPHQPTIPAGVPVPPQHAPGPQLALGDITVVGDQIITPAGPMPLKGAAWNVMDMSRTEEKISTTGIVLAVVFFVFCFLGLLFLLMKEKKTTGFIQVTVTSGGRYHSTMIPATAPETLQWVMGQLNYARSLSI
ncbi:hypothetical protein [Streptomyces showdoensis]|uniref:Uncharacterized protein n=1 Tax=Streptomyces showdoensis TaxID=68268 RepID=A0A2P2GN04_STREW|nr:hypothetical protein [Streptomyces showdoensis]KKZ72888.1 hypothetical protein VO63_16255 [Streptomyces showdoensis]